MFIRGGNANFNKVLVDGIPVNDIGGAFDLGRWRPAASSASRSSANEQRHIRQRRAGRSHQHHDEARTHSRPRGRILDRRRQPGHLRHDVLGRRRRAPVRLLLELFTVRHEQRRAEQRVRKRHVCRTVRGGDAGNTDLSVSIRRIDSEYESSNAILNYGIADDSSQDKQQTCFTASARTLWTDRLQSTIRFGWTDEQFAYVNPTPTGEPFDPFGFGANYLGNTVTLRGADGRSVTGRAILDFGGTYPSIFETRTDRRLIAGDTTFYLHEMLPFRRVRASNRSAAMTTRS